MIKSLKRLTSIAISVFTIVCIANAQTSTVDLSLDGANLHDMAVSPDGALVIAATQGPKGIFYSTDFGESWQDARDAVYISGEGNSISFNSNYVFVATSDQLLLSPIATKLAWQEIPIEGQVRAIASTDNYLIIGTGDARIIVLDINAQSIVASYPLPNANSGENNIDVGQLALDLTAGYIFVQTGQFEGTNNHLYRADFDQNSGTIGSFAEKEPLLAKGHYTGVFVAPNQDVYVMTHNAPSGEEGVLRSKDHGESYQRIADDRNQDIGYIDSQFLAAAGTTYLLGSNLSFDSGESWISVNSQTIGGANLNQNAGAVNPANVNQALISSDVGCAKSSNLNQGENATWKESNNGLKGLTVNDIAQTAEEQNRVLLSTKSGVAFSDNFLSSPPTWQFPIFPAGDGAPNMSAVINPADNNQVFTGSGSIHEGLIAEDLSISWQTIFNQHDYQWGNLTTSDLVVYGNTLVSSHYQRENELYGMLIFWDISSSPAREIRRALEGKPVRGFAAVSDQLMFAAVGTYGFVDGVDKPENNGVYLSQDGGVSWTQLSKLPYDVKAKGLKYFPEKDYLFVYGSRLDQSLTATDNNGEPPSETPELPLSGAFLRLDNASKIATKGEKWSEAAKGLDYYREFDAMTVSPDAGSIYLSAGQNIYQSLDFGSLWTLYYQGLNSENTSVLFFEDASESVGNFTTLGVSGKLIQASNANFQKISGYGKGLNVVGVNYKKKKGKVKSKSAIKLNLNASKDQINTRKNKKLIRVRVSGSKKSKIVKKIQQKKNGLTTIKLSPGRNKSWPKGKKVRIKIKKGFKASNNDSSRELDGDYDHQEGGNYKKTVTISPR